MVIPEALEDSEEGIIPEIHMSRKGGMSGTSSSRSLMEDAIWKSDEDSVGILLDAMAAGIGAMLILIVPQRIRGLVARCYASTGWKKALELMKGEKLGKVLAVQWQLVIITSGLATNNYFDARSSLE